MYNSNRLVNHQEQIHTKADFKHKPGSDTSQVISAFRAINCTNTDQTTRNN